MRLREQEIIWFFLNDIKKSNHQWSQNVLLHSIKKNNEVVNNMSFDLKQWSAEEKEIVEWEKIQHGNTIINKVLNYLVN